RQMRHRVVAERIFDEMERALSDFLAREEARPVDPVGGTDPGGPPFVLGRFWIDAEGRVKTEGRGNRATEEAVERAVGLYANRERAKASGQLAGTTIGLADEGQAEKAAPAATDARDASAAKEVSAYDALRALNKGVLQRAERQKTQAVEAEAKQAPASPARRDASASAFEPGPPPMSGRVVDAERFVLQRTVARGAQAF